MADRKIMYVPRELLDELTFHVLTPAVRAAIGDDDVQWGIERLMEAAYQRGYEEGYMRARIDEGRRRAEDAAAPPPASTDGGT